MLDEGAHDLTLSSPAAPEPLPAPTTVTTRSLRPRRVKSRGHSSAAISASNSRSNSVMQADPSLAMEVSSTNRGTPDAAKSEDAPDELRTDVAIGVDQDRVKKRQAAEVSADDLGRVAGPSGVSKRQKTDVEGSSMTTGTDENTVNVGSSHSLAQESTVRMEVHHWERADKGDKEGGDISLVASEVQDFALPGSSTHASPSTATLEIVPQPSGRHHAADGDQPVADSSRLPSPAHTPRAEPVRKDEIIDVDDLPLTPYASSSSSTQTASSTSRLVTSPSQLSILSPPPSTLTSAPSQSEIPVVELLSDYNCPICFSPPIYATLTPCGHICCGECLFTAIKTTMQRATYSGVPGERSIARCPVCRAPIPGWDGKGGGVIGLKPRAVFSL